MRHIPALTFSHSWATRPTEHPLSSARREVALSRSTGREWHSDRVIAWMGDFDGDGRNGLSLGGRLPHVVPFSNCLDDLYFLFYLPQPRSDFKRSNLLEPLSLVQGEYRPNLPDRSPRTCRRPESDRSNCFLLQFLFPCMGEKW